MTRTSRAKLTLADFDQWAAPLQDTIPRVLAENLALLIPTERVVLHPWSRTIAPNYPGHGGGAPVRAGPRGQVVLAARWSLLDHDGKERVLRTTRLSQAAGGTDYEATVTAMGRTIEALAQDIATTLEPDPARHALTAGRAHRRGRPGA